MATITKEQFEQISKTLPSMTNDEKLKFVEKLDKGDIDLTDTLGVSNTTPKGLGVARFVVKNFANDTEQAVEYLKNNYPDYQFKLSEPEKEGEQKEILVKEPNSVQFTRLDPKGFDLRDITDEAYGVISGAVPLATKALGVAGSPVTLGASIPASMAAGAAEQAGLETLRQSIGKAIGVSKEYDPSQIALAGGIGATVPIGTRGSAWVTKKSAPIMRKLVGYGGGIRKEVTEKLEEKLPMFNKWRTEGGVAKSAEDLVTKADQAIKDKEQELAQKMITGMGNKPLSVSNSIKTIDDELARLQKGAQTSDKIDMVNSLNELKQYLFGVPTEGVDAAGKKVVNYNFITEFEPEDIIMKRRELADIRDFGANSNLGSSLAQKGSTFKKQAQHIAGKVYKALNQDIDTQVEGNETARMAFKELKDTVEPVSKKLNEGRKLYTTGATVETSTTPGATIDKDVIRQIDKAIPEAGLKDAMLTAETYERAGKGGLFPEEIFSASGIKQMGLQLPGIIIPGAIGAGAASMAGLPWYVGALGGAVAGAPMVSPSGQRLAASVSRNIQKINPWVARPMLERTAASAIRSAYTGMEGEK